jgi:hypothetical protein
LAPLVAFNNMHCRLGAEIRTLRVRHEVKKRCNGALFLFTARFTASKAGKELSITDQTYDATYIGPPARARDVHHVSVCGCHLEKLAMGNPLSSAKCNIVDFLIALKNYYPCGSLSYRTADLECYGEDIHRGLDCLECRKQGLSRVWF